MISPPLASNLAMIHGCRAMTETITRNATKDAVVQQPRLLDQVRTAIRTRHYSLRTERAYVHWIKRYIYFHGKRHPIDMGATEIEAFLSAPRHGSRRLSQHPEPGPGRPAVFVQGSPGPRPAMAGRHHPRKAQQTPAHRPHPG